jgi:hypothetical protein
MHIKYFPTLFLLLKKDREEINWRLEILLNATPKNGGSNIVL